MTEQTQTPLSLPSLEEIQALTNHELVHRMRIGVEHFDPRIFDLDHEQLDQAWLPEAGVGRWPIRILLGHLADVEMLFSSRIRAAVAIDNPTYPDFDEHAYIDSGIYGCTESSPFRPPTGGDVAMIHTTRAWLVAFLIQLEDHHWERSGIHAQRGPVSVRTTADYNCWHLEHHAAFLNAKVFKLLGPAPEPEACNDGGCGKPGCACH